MSEEGRDFGELSRAVQDWPGWNMFIKMGASEKNSGAGEAPGPDSSEIPHVGVRSAPVPMWRRYVIALGSVLVAFAIRYWLTPLLGDELPFLLFVAAALVAAWYGGAATGIVALLLGLFLADYFFLRIKHRPPFPLSVDWLQFIRYVFTASLGIALIEVMHRDRRRVEAAVEELGRQMERRRRTEAELREAQAQLHRHADELEGRVEERASQLKSTVEYLRGLLYHIGHNLRAPLRAMAGYSALLSGECRGRLNAAELDYLGRIAEAARHMDELIRDLLVYGRLGYVEVSLTRVNLKSAIERCLPNLAYKIKTKQAELVVSDPLPNVLAHGVLLEQVLTNLIDNALEFVTPGTVPHVQVRAETRAGQVVRLWIEDNGIGIAPEYHERIFGAFESLYPGRGHEGTGIGLAIVKQCMQRMGGNVGVESALGSGSRFWVELQKAGEIESREMQKVAARLRGEDPCRLREE